MQSNAPLGNPCGRCGRPTTRVPWRPGMSLSLWECIPCAADFYKPAPYVCNKCGSYSTKTDEAVPQYYCLTCSERDREKEREYVRLNSKSRCLGCGVGIGNPMSFAHRDNLCDPCRDKHDQSQNKGFFGGLFG